MPPSPLYYTMSYYSLLFFTPPTLCAAIHHYSSNTLVHITHCISLGWTQIAAHILCWIPNPAAPQAARRGVRAIVCFPPRQRFFHRDFLSPGILLGSSKDQLKNWGYLIRFGNTKILLLKKRTRNRRFPRPAESEHICQTRNIGLRFQNSYLTSIRPRAGSIKQKIFG